MGGPIPALTAQAGDARVLNAMEPGWCHVAGHCHRRKQSFSLALGLQSCQSQQGGIRWNSFMAARAVTMLPVIVRFFLTQKTFIQGIAATGSKGGRRTRPGHMRRDCGRELGVVIALLCRKNHASTCSYPPTD